MIKVFFIISCLAASACGVDESETTLIEVKDYDTTCADDNDCMWIKLGATCDCCEFSAINKKDLEQYENNLGKTSDCDPAMPPYAAPTVTCEEGTCTAVPQ